MRSTPVYACVVSAAALAACADPSDPLSVGGPPAPTEALGFGTRTVYEVTTLASLGGSVSSGRSVNERGWVAGFSNRPNDETRTAVVWRGGEPSALRTLGGPNSSTIWAGQNVRGTVVGIAETTELDPLGKNFSCHAFFPGEHTGHICRGFVWDGGVIRELPTLGGNNGFASAVNNRGQIVGWAENEVRDPTCELDRQVLQFRAVLWGPGEGQISELPPFPGDSASAAVAINDLGQVVGISGECDQAVGRASARRVVLWERGKVADLGNIGGGLWNTPTYISLRGDVVGFGGLADEGEPLQPFLWTRRDGMQRLSLDELADVEGCRGGQANATNVRRQVVGVATQCGDNNDEIRAFLWEGGVMRNLNDLVGQDTDLQLLAARGINVWGQITGEALDPETGEVVAFVATPGRRGRLPR